MSAMTRPAAIVPCSSTGYAANGSRTSGVPGSFPNVCTADRPAAIRAASHTARLSQYTARQPLSHATLRTPPLEAVDQKTARGERLGAVTADDLHEHARLPDRHIAHRVVDTHRVAVEAVRGLPGKVGEYPPSQRLVCLIGQLPERTVLGMDLHPGAAQERALGAGGRRERLHRHRLHRTVEDLHVDVRRGGGHAQHPIGWRRGSTTAHGT
jgi:hypothetical protein